MIFAISTDNDMVSPHFGRCPFFTIGEIHEGEVVRQESVPNPGHHPGFLPEFLAGREVNCIIAGGMGQRARMLFDEKNIMPILGIEGSIPDVIRALCEGTLKGGESLCAPGRGKEEGYGIDKTECTHEEDHA